MIRMARRSLDFETVRKLARELGDIDDPFGTAPAVKVGGKLLACIPRNKSAEPGSLVVRIDIEDRADLIAEAPEIYYVTDHYENYPTVLVRLGRIEPDALRDLLGTARAFIAKSDSRAVRRRRKKKAI
jgi:hypothetical protein